MFDTVIIGSGYGGSVVAARLGGRERVLLLERGRRWRPGDFPETLLELARATMTRRHPLGLWSMRFGLGTGVAFANALGGSSVVNYGITVRPDAHVFEGWPITEAELAPYFARALEVLAPTPSPRADSLGDKQLLDRLAPGAREDIANTIDWDRCTDCGRCVPGCNLGAKRSLDRSYLARAEAAGVEIRVEAEALSIERRPGGYEVLVRRTGSHDTPERIATRRVVLAAGALGTLELLHRSRGALALGPLFGQRMSLNGDGMAFLHDTGEALSSHSGAPISTAARLATVGPDGRPRTLYAMSGRVPKAIMGFAAGALAIGAEGLGALTRGGGRARAKGGRDRLASGLRRLRDLAGPSAAGAFSRSLMYKLDGQDEGLGVARFVDDRVVIDWPSRYLDEPVNRFADETLAAWARQTGARVVGNVASLPGMRSFSVHPLGGCRMGASIADGVVDSFGRVFDPAGGVYEGLVVADGSIIPTELGVPPSLTITALAERIAERLGADGLA